MGSQVGSGIASWPDEVPEQALAPAETVTCLRQ